MRRHAPVAKKHVRKSARLATRLVRRLALESLEPRQLLAADMVLQWNELIDDAIRADTTQPGPTYAARNYAIVQLAVYDALQSIIKTTQPYLVDATAPYYASQDAAVAAAAHRALVGLYPLQAATFDAFFNVCLAAIPDGLAEDAGVAVGIEVAEAILANRAADHAGDVVSYMPGTGPGEWRPAPPIEATPAWGAGWGNVTPFMMQTGDQFRPPAPPSLTSAQYTDAFNEVKELGAANSATRTAEQTQIGIFWGYDRGGLGPPPILYNQIARSISINQNLTLQQNARLFAIANVAQAEAGVVSWDTKFEYNFWRPITAIREADTDGNPETIADPTWEPLGAPGGGVVPNFTPPFPAYTSGHATFGAAFFRSLSNFFGTDRFAFDATSDELPGVTRHYVSFSQAAAENARSRIYLGIHWNFDDSYGQSTGRDVADYVFDHIFQPRAVEPIEIMAGMGQTGPAQVRMIHTDGAIVDELLPYDASFLGGVRVAMGDLNQDGIDELLTAAGPNGGPHVRVFDGATGNVIRDFMAYSADFTGGVFVAAGDVDGDGVDDIITGADAGGGPHVRVFSGATGAELASFFAFSANFTGGVRVAAADVDGDGKAEIVTAAGTTGGPHVRVFQANGAGVASFFAYSASFTGGVYVAGGDTDGDGRDEVIVAAGAGGGPHVRVFNIATGHVDLEFMAYAPFYLGGVQVAVADCDGDGRADILTAPGSDQNSSVRIFQGYTGVELDHFRAFAQFNGAVYLAAGNTGAQNLLASDGSSTASNGIALTQEELDTIRGAALARWSATGVTGAELAVLQGAELRVADLPAGVLARTAGRTIYVDPTAAGRGWFIDPTPASDEEFGSGEVDGIDLLTAISHELGHLLGLAHESDSVMAGTLPIGVRRLPSARDVDLLFAADAG